MITFKVTGDGTRSTAQWNIIERCLGASRITSRGYEGYEITNDGFEGDRYCTIDEPREGDMPALHSLTVCGLVEDVHDDHDDIGWIPVTVELPPNGKIVNTKIDDEQGCRNVQLLKRDERLWFLPDSSMYVYYEPTHWAEV